MRAPSREARSAALQNAAYLRRGMGTKSPMKPSVLGYGQMARVFRLSA